MEVPFSNEEVSLLKKEASFLIDEHPYLTNEISFLTGAVSFLTKFFIIVPFLTDKVLFFRYEDLLSTEEVTLLTDEVPSLRKYS